MSRRKAPAYTNTRIRRLPVSRAVHEHWTGIPSTMKGGCCGDLASLHLVTVRADGSPIIRCVLEGCPCKTWIDGERLAPVIQLPVNPLDQIKWGV